MKRLLFLMLSIVLLLGLVSCEPEETTVERLLRINFDDVDKISLFNGDSGKEYVSNDPEEIKNFLKQFRQVKVCLDEDQSVYFGGGIQTDLYKGEKKIGSFNYTEVDMLIPERYVTDNPNILRYKIIPRISEEEYDAIGDKIDLYGKRFSQEQAGN